LPPPHHPFAMPSYHAISSDCGSLLRLCHATEATRPLRCTFSSKSPCPLLSPVPCHRSHAPSTMHLLVEIFVPSSVSCAMPRS
jgi:hypothetical protein